MSMRLRGSKTDVESAGLDAEGMATSVSKLRDEIQSLSGVDIMLNEDTFKSSYDILMGIGEVWDGLSDINQANITELLFGKRQANIGTAILQNYERAQEIYADSLDSEGSAVASKTATVCGNTYCKTYLTAGNPLEPCTTIIRKLDYDGLTTQGLGVLRRSS